MDPIRPKVILLVSRGGETRAKILKALNNSEFGLLNTNQISNKIGMEWGTVKYEIELLKREGLIEEVESHHRTKFYTLTDIGKELSKRISD
ncbi:MAG: winged helix-turn-helix domain-containing protein [Candidatus Hydrothermarchaeota archaeon]